MTSKKIDMPRIGEIRYCTKEKAHVLIKDLILGNGVCDAVVYYVRSKKTDQVPTKQLVKQKISNKDLLKLRNRLSPGVHPAFSNKYFRKHKISKYYPQTKWSDVKWPKNTIPVPKQDVSEKINKPCGCSMTTLLRNGCQCGGV